MLFAVFVRIGEQCATVFRRIFFSCKVNSDSPRLVGGLRDAPRATAGRAARRGSCRAQRGMTRGRRECSKRCGLARSRALVRASDDVRRAVRRVCLGARQRDSRADVAARRSEAAQRWLDAPCRAPWQRRGVVARARPCRGKCRGFPRVCEFFPPAAERLGALAPSPHATAGRVKLARGVDTRIARRRRSAATPSARRRAPRAVRAPRVRRAIGRRTRARSPATRRRSHRWQRCRRGRWSAAPSRGRADAQFQSAKFPKNFSKKILVSGPASRRNRSRRRTREARSTCRAGDTTTRGSAIFTRLARSYTTLIPAGKVSI